LNETNIYRVNQTTDEDKPEEKNSVLTKQIRCCHGTVRLHAELEMSMNMRNEKPRKN
jgi:hypothetical protein